MTAARRKRWPRRLLIAGVLLGAAWWWVDRQLEPQRLSRTVLDQLEQQQGLELEFSGEPEYALRPEPRLLLPNVVARLPGAATDILRAERVEVSLPWSTILDGEALLITRIELDTPVLDVAALATWQATRPPAPLELPTLTRGLAVKDGTVVGDGWRVHALSLELPVLDAAQAAAMQFSARIEYDAAQLDAKGVLAIDKGVVAASADLQASGTLRHAETTGPISVRAKGPYDLAADAPFWKIEELALMLAPGWPKAQASGSLRLGTPLDARLQGELAHWPADWPVLPEPLQSSDAPLRFELAYAGAADLSAPLQLRVGRDGASFDGSFSVPALRAWSERPDRTPLPPLQAEISAPMIEVGGATLEGVRIHIEEDPPATVEPPSP